MKFLKKNITEIESIKNKDIIDFNYLLNKYKYYLFSDYIPFWKKNGSDNEVGGFMCSMDHAGKNINFEKNVWYQGRGLWVHCMLYKHFGDEWNLDIAKKTKEFLIKFGRDDDGYWVQNLDRHGKILQPKDITGTTGLFVAEGLQEYAEIASDYQCMEVAIESIKKSLLLYDNVHRYEDHWYIPKNYPGMRIQGFEMVALILLTQITKKITNLEFEEKLEKFIDNIINKFWNTDYKLNNEVLDYQYQLPDDKNSDFIYLGHAIEVLWMIMFYSLLHGKNNMFILAAERFKRHLEVSWDHIYGGYFRAISVNSKYTFDKVLWLQEEVLIGLMLLIENTKLTWPVQWFIKTFDYVEKNYPLNKYGYSLWKIGGDRKINFNEYSNRKENYHHPRHLIYNILSIQRIISNNYK